MSKVIDRIDIEMLVRQHLQELGLDGGSAKKKEYICLLYTSDAADDR